MNLKHKKFKNSFLERHQNKTLENKMYFWLVWLSWSWRIGNSWSHVGASYWKHAWRLAASLLQVRSYLSGLSLGEIATWYDGCWGYSVIQHIWYEIKIRLGGACLRYVMFFTKLHLNLCSFELIVLLKLWLLFHEVDKKNSCRTYHQIMHGVGDFYKL